jgi:hypothetical protein
VNAKFGTSGGLDWFQTAAFIIFYAGFTKKAIATYKA